MSYTGMCGLGMLDTGQHKVGLKTEEVKSKV